MKQIIGYEHYQIDESGNVYNSKSKRLSYSIDNKGYNHVNLSLNGNKRTFTVHRLVALHFIPNTLNLPQVNHINGNKSDNRVENLEWCTGSYNLKMAYLNNQKCAKGENNGRSKLKESEVILIKQLIKNKTKLKDIAKQFNIHPNVISEIKRGIKWKHIIC